MLEGLFDWFLDHGMVYALIGIFVILVIDAAVFPALPEVFATIAFLLDPTLAWGIALLITALLAEFTGNSLLYALVRRSSLPGFIKTAMNKWTDFIFLKDERMILINRVAPIVPFTGAFMAVCKWNYWKSMLYLMVGGAVKYGALFALIALFNIRFEREQAQIFTIISLFIIICLSFLSSYLYKRKLGTQKSEGKDEGMKDDARSSPLAEHEDL